jgi:ADP-ribosylglycohydrolase
MTVSHPPAGRPLLDWLLDHGLVELERTPALDAVPPPLPTAGLRDRVEGMLLGLAVGDALGNTTESMAPRRRHERFGELRDYLPNPHAGGRRVGTPSDDTQMACWTVEHLLEGPGGVRPAELADLFGSRPIFGSGSTVREFLMRRGRGCDWWDAGPRSAGNGAIMRIAPVVLPHLRAPSPALWADAVLAAMVTHDDRASNAACAAWVALLWGCLAGEPPRARGWWLDTFAATAAPLEGETCYRGRSPDAPYAGTMTNHVLAAREPLARGVPVREACDAWHSGAYLLETATSALYILEAWGHDPEEAIVLAVNDTWDNDTIAALVGAAVGALHGRAALPARWLDDLTGRTGRADDGRVFELAARAAARFA